MSHPTVYSVSLDAATGDPRSGAHGRSDRATFATGNVTRSTLQPGWRWSEHVGRAQGLTLCSVPHLGYVVAGRMVVGAGTVLSVQHVNLL